MPGPIMVTLRLEGAVALLAAVFGYRALGGGWGMFALLFLVPDLGMVGYLANPCRGATLYNAVHTYTAPGALAAAGLWAGSAITVLVALVWVAHIGFDRMLGYGLKSVIRFGDTHLG